jgi:hypothetical protein
LYRPSFFAACIHTAEQYTRCRTVAVNADPHQRQYFVGPPIIAIVRYFLLIKKLAYFIILDYFPDPYLFCCREAWDGEFFRVHL